MGSRLTMSLRRTKPIRTTKMTNPICIQIWRALGLRSRRKMLSMIRTKSWPPSKTGIGKEVEDAELEADHGDPAHQGQEAHLQGGVGEVGDLQRPAELAGRGRPVTRFLRKSTTRKTSRLFSLIALADGGEEADIS